MNWTLIGGVLLGAIVLRVIGFIPSIWIALGFAGLVWFWHFLLTQFATQKKLINWGMGIILAVGLLSTIGWNLYQIHIQPYTGMSRAATERAKLAADLETTLRINPHMLKSRMELLNTIQWLQDKIGERDAAEVDGVRRSLLKRDITPEDAWKIIFKILEEENLNRKKAKDAISRLSVSLDLKPRLPKNNNSTASGLFIIGAILLGVGLIPKVNIPGKKFWGGVGMLVLVIALILWRFPGIEAKMMTEAIPSRPTAPAPAPAPKITELACATVVVPAGETLNTHFFVRPGQRVHFYRKIPVKYYIHGRTIDLPVDSDEFSCEFSNSDYVWLKGGPVTTMVTLKK